ncbi:hypothetical protein [Flavobacterium sp.]|uniref:hypothetical protein n=1 Tax=Flavobacterium sp. TaxID=239 RepID=UPI00286C8DE5|nr:hypothetical protein [Flavobacterium sp.]
MKKIKNILSYIFIFILIISCKGKITSIKLNNLENNGNNKCYMQKIGEHPDSIILAKNYPWIKDRMNTIFIYMPISFKLENKTGRDLRISKIWDNYSIGQYRPVFINNKYYEDIEGKASISSGNNADITLFVHLPVSINLIDKIYYDRLYPKLENYKRDSIVINNINSQLQKEINVLLKRKQIYISYHESKNIKEKALAYYCVEKQKLGVFRSDSLAKLKTTFRYNCD